ncbi:hypothetical protein NL676_019109 [Syzygium grande]|nr:hypothetical protein NL676_019109 [Syzygium grande]
MSSFPATRALRPPSGFAVARITGDGRASTADPKARPPTGRPAASPGRAVELTVAEMRRRRSRPPPRRGGPADPLDIRKKRDDRRFARDRSLRGAEGGGPWLPLGAERANERPGLPLGGKCGLSRQYNISLVHLTIMN